MDQLHSEAAGVETRLDLADFVQSMVSVAASPDIGEWENTLPRFLDGLGAWISNMDGYFENRGLVTPNQPSWNLIADMLIAATMYE